MAKIWVWVLGPEELFDSGCYREKWNSKRWIQLQVRYIIHVPTSASPAFYSTLTSPDCFLYSILFSQCFSSSNIASWKELLSFCSNSSTIIYTAVAFEAVAFACPVTTHPSRVFWAFTYTQFRNNSGEILYPSNTGTCDAHSFTGSASFLPWNSWQTLWGKRGRAPSG